MPRLCKNCAKINIVALSKEPEFVDGRTVRWKQETSDDAVVDGPSITLARNLLALEDSARRGCSFCAFAWQSILVAPKAMERSPRAKRAGLVDQLIKEPVTLCIDWTGSFEINPEFIDWPVLLLRPWNVELVVIGAMEGEDCQIIPPTTKQVSVDPRSDAVLQQCQQWMSHCTQNHQSCGSGQTHEAPPRLIDVGTDLKDPSACLVETRTSSAPGNYAFHDYFALSYCWGKPSGQTHHHISKNENIRDRLKSFQISILPNTIRDAIEITRLLGKRYLWVDSICIIQDNDEDKHENIGKMQNIYKNATCTLSAVDSKQAMYGMLHPRDWARYSTFSAQVPMRASEASCPADQSWWNKIVPSKRKKGPAQPPGHFIPDNDKDLSPTFFPCIRPYEFESAVDRSSIESRGWTWQERMLSARRLCFSDWGVFWECHELTASELHPDGFLQDSNWDRLMSQLYHDTHWPPVNIPGFDWRDLMAKASRRQLTNPDDRLVSLAGVAEEYHQRRVPGDTYLAGLWLSSLALDLCWQADNHDHKDKTDEFPYWDPSAPTWSWAAQRRQSVRWPSWLSADTGGKVDMVAQVLQHAVIPESDLSSYGKVKSGRLVLRGWLGSMDLRPLLTNIVPCETVPIRSPGRELWRDCPGKTVRGVRVFALARSDNKEKDTGSEHPNMHWALLLIPAEKEAIRESGGGCWRRIGLLSTIFDEDFRFCEKTTITLI